MKTTFKETLLTEARDPNVKYTERLVKKEVDRVIATLEGAESAVMTRLTNRYHRLDKALKLMKIKRDELNLKVKGQAEDLFDPSDTIYTRVVETVSCTLTLSKAVAAVDKTQTYTVDYKAIAAELEALIDKDLIPKIDEIKAKYTRPDVMSDSPVALRVKSKLEEGIAADAWAKIKKVWTTWGKALATWGKAYDKKLAKINKSIK